MDARSPEEYFAILDRLPTGRRMDEETIAACPSLRVSLFLPADDPGARRAPTTGMIAKFLKYRLDVSSLDRAAPRGGPRPRRHLRRHRERIALRLSRGGHVTHPLRRYRDGRFRVSLAETTPRFIAFRSAPIAGG